MSCSTKVKNVYPIGNLLLLVEFENGIKKTYDIHQLLEDFPIYLQLEDEGIFHQVKVDCGGYGIAWTDRAIAYEKK